MIHRRNPQKMSLSVINTTHVETNTKELLMGISVRNKLGSVRLGGVSENKRSEKSKGRRTQAQLGRTKSRQASIHTTVCLMAV